jgi:hypothetical protein
MAVVAKSYRDIEAALLEAGYGGIVAGPLFGGSNAGCMPGVNTTQAKPEKGNT